MDAASVPPHPYGAPQHPEDPPCECEWPPCESPSSSSVKLGRPPLLSCEWPADVELWMTGWDAERSGMRPRSVRKCDREGRCGTKKDHATGTSAEKATRGGGRTPPTVANLGGPGFTERDKACGGDGHAMGACVGRTVGTGVRVDAYAAQPSRAASVRDARRET